MVILLKPTLKCNQRCLHCYETPNRKNIDLSVEKTIYILDKLKKIYGFKDGTIIFHGGEPSLMGYDFYKGVLNGIDRNVYKRISIQTGLLDVQIISLIGNYSTSFEYPHPLHDPKTPAKILKILAKTNINTFVVNTLWKKNEKVHGSKVYKFYKELNTPFRFNYIVNVGEGKQNQSLVFSPVAKWLQRIIEIFDSWFLDKTSIYVEPLLSITEAFLFRSLNICSFTSMCYKHIVAVDPDGELSQCGRLYNYPYGNIKDIDSIESLKSNSHYRGSYERELNIRYTCKSCEYFYICGGGCKGNSMIVYGSLLKQDPNCAFYKKLFNYIEKKIDKSYNATIDWILSLNSKKYCSIKSCIGNSKINEPISTTYL